MVDGPRYRRFDRAPLVLDDGDDDDDDLPDPEPFYDGEGDVVPALAAPRRPVGLPALCDFALLVVIPALLVAGIVLW